MISFTLIQVPTNINLNSQFCLKAKEIQNKSFHWMLSSELISSKASITKDTPKKNLCIGGICPQHAATIQG
jgi:hypothetical protein